MFWPVAEWGVFGVFDVFGVLQPSHNVRRSSAWRRVGSEHIVWSVIIITSARGLVYQVRANMRTGGRELVLSKKN